MNVPKLRFKNFNENWREYTVGEITESLKSGLSRLLQHQDIGIPVIRANNIDKGQLNYNDLKYWYINDPQGANTENYIIQKNDILINFINSEAKMGTTAIVLNEPFRKMIYTTNILKMNTNELADNYFFYCYTDTKKYKDYIKLITKPAVNQASFTTVDYKKQKILMPTISEQIKISSFFKVLNKKIQLQQEKIDLLKKQKKEFMQKIFSRELRFKTDNQFFDEWKEVELGNITMTFSGGTPSVSNRSYYTGNIPFIRSGEIHTDRTELYISETAINNSSAKTVEVGDILYALYGATSGEVAISQIAGAINQAILCIRTDQNKLFVKYWLENMKEQILSVYLQGGQGNLSASIIKSLKINLPHIDEQSIIANFFNTFDKKIHKEEIKLNSLLQQKQAFMQQMFL